MSRRKSHKQHSGTNEAKDGMLVVPSIDARLPSIAVAPPEQGTGLDWRIILGALRRRWLLASGLGLTFGLATAAIAWFATDAPFTAVSELRIKEVRERILFHTSESESRFETYKQTQMQLLRNPFVLAPALRLPEAAGLAMLAEHPRPVEFLEEKLVVSSPATEFIRISLSGDNPQELATLVNCVTKAYVEEVVKQDESKRTARKTKLEEVLHEVTERLRSKQSAMQKLAVALHTGDSQALTVKQQMAVEYYGQIRKEHAQIRFDLLKLKSQLAGHGTSGSKGAQAEIPESLLDSAVAGATEIRVLSDRVKRFETLLGQTKERVARDDHPSLKNLRADLAAAQSSLELERARIRPRIIQEIKQSLSAATQASTADIRNQIALLSSQQEQLEEELEKQKIEAKQIGISSFELEFLRQEVEQIQKVADSVSSEIERLEIELGSPVRIEIVRIAEAPHKPDMSKKYKLTAAGGFGVLALCVAAVALLEIRRRRINTIGQLTDGLSLKIVGTLPIMPDWAMHPKTARHQTRRSALQSIWTESIDSARTTLLRNPEFDSVRLLMVASAVGGEGKTTLSSHLATSLARAGRKTLLIDTDMRRPSLNRVFDVPLTPGFCELIRGEATLDEVLVPLPMDGLFLVPAGKMTAACLQSLANNGADQWFERFESEYDFTIVDSAPILPVTDSLLISQYVDGALFAIRRDVSQYSQVAAACQRLTLIGVPLLGAVAIGIDDHASGFATYRYRSYNSYAYYSATEE